MKYLGFVLDFSVKQEKSKDIDVKHSMSDGGCHDERYEEDNVLRTKSTKFHRRLLNLFFCFKNQENEG